MDRQIDREKGIHGRQWNSFHEGYFSRADVAMPLVNVIREYAEKTHSDVIIDLGGGTGVILSELEKQGIDGDVKLVNLDLSEDQLKIATGNGLVCIASSAADFRREMALSEKESLLLAMRSVLHYFGKDGLPGILAHLREQVRKGEIFIHQTACFQDAEDAECLNRLYDSMKTPKWYPTVEELNSELRATGWHVEKLLPAQALPLTSQDLTVRYGLTEDDIDKVRTELLGRFGEKKSVFRLEDNGFRASLHYWTFVCS